DDCNLTFELTHDLSFGSALIVRGHPENLDMGPPPSAVQCGKTHIGGAKIIQSSTRHRSAYAVRHGVAFLWKSGKNRLYRRTMCRIQPQKSTRVVPDRTMIDWDDVRYFLAVARG